MSTDIKKPKFGSANASIYKYISGNFYHPNTRFEDLQGLSINKSGDCDLIQANTKLIAVPLSGPGGRVGIINTEKPGRLPIHVPSILCNSEVTNFRFDPFNDNILVTVSNDNKIRVWEIPEGGIEEDMAEPKAVLQAGSMDKVHLLEFHPTTKNVLLTASDDLGHPTIRIWDLQTQKEEIALKTQHHDVIFSCSWSPDGTQIATTTKEKKIRVLDARTGDIVAEGTSHNSIRPSRLDWLDNNLLISTGFGLGSTREVLLFNKQDLSKPLHSKTIDVSPSVMSTHYDPDCQVLFVAGRGDRTIHTFHVEDNALAVLAKIEASSLQQGFAFLPKRACNVKEVEIDKFYRLTPTNIEVVGVRVPRARPEFFQDDIFVPTLDTEHPAQDAANWFKNENKQLNRISLQPNDMSPLSTAPPPASQAQSKAKFEMGKRYVSEEQRKKEQMERMFSIAKNIEGDDDIRPKTTNPEDEEVADEEWDD
ncbi:uncharacterized protein B0P05DRAFT_524970 [Gilbertella persicaria]|uniref:uncharacterized protein n=1 Tax=Gilbertella persicaria TaxID=101096 RepID=UPI00221FB692|nr:uncharacterized protein B0P05DRAFT_524970 [Gilbertella persicaria]KAI8092155.1 hypothetical protein B0P05DRAFT_524970 [Gilbertella persicaria]